jgi:hypothetical protein
VSIGGGLSFLFAQMEDMNSGQTMLFGERKVRKRKKIQILCLIMVLSIKIYDES